MKKLKVAIVITTYNQRELLFKCLDSLKNETKYPDYRVYFVDDSGKGEIGAEIKKKYSWVDVSINKINTGFSKANNTGMRAAIKEYDPDYLLLLNDDTETIQPDWLKKFVNAGEKDKKIGILGGKIVYPDKSLQNIGGYIKKWEIAKELKDRKDTFEVDHVMGAFLLIKKSVIEKIGLLDEVYSPYLLEDTDYCLRAKRAGFKVVSVGSVVIVHKKGKSIDSLKSKRSTLVRFKNDFIFSFRNLKFPYNFIRAFAYLPMVAVFKKRTDEDSPEIKNLILREDFIVNILLYIISPLYAIKDIIFLKKIR